MSREPGPGRREPLDVRGALRVIGQVRGLATEPAGQHVGVRRGHRRGLVHQAGRDHAAGHRVVAGEQPGLLGRLAQPVGAAVAQPAQGHLVAARHRGHERGRRGVAPRPLQVGYRVAGRRDRGQRGLAEIAARPHGGHQHRQRGLRGHLGRLVGAGRGRDAIADHGHYHRAIRSLLGGQRHRVLVTVMPEAPVADAGSGTKVDLGMVSRGRVGDHVHTLVPAIVRRYTPMPYSR